MCEWIPSLLSSLFRVLCRCAAWLGNSLTSPWSRVPRSRQSWNVRMPFVCRAQMQMCKAAVSLRSPVHSKTSSFTPNFRAKFFLIAPIHIITKMPKCHELSRNFGDFFWTRAWVQTAAKSSGILWFFSLIVPEHFLWNGWRSATCEIIAAKLAVQGSEQWTPTVFNSKTKSTRLFCPWSASSSTEGTFSLAETSSSNRHKTTSTLSNVTRGVSAEILQKKPSWTSLH